MDLPLFAHIRTERLSLTPVGDADPEELATALDDWECVRWLARVPWPYTRDDAAAFVTMRQATPAPVWSIRRDERLIGGIGLDPHLGYWLNRDHWGRGFATEAARAVLAAHFANGAASPVETQYMDGNVASARVLEKLGFAHVGTVRIRSRALGREMPGHRLVLTRDAFKERHGFRLQTTRLRLREVCLDDAAALARIGGDAQVAPMIMPATVPWPVALARRFVASLIWKGGLGFGCVICGADGMVIGWVGLNPRGQLFYFLDPAHWGQGLMTEALAAFLTEVESRFPWLEIGAGVFTDNPASARVLERLGFSRIGRDEARSAARLEPCPVWIYRKARADCAPGGDGR